MKDQINMAWSAAKRKAGTGWDILGPDFQEALVAKEALDIIGNQCLPAGPDEKDRSFKRLDEVLQYAKTVLR